MTDGKRGTVFARRTRRATARSTRRGAILAGLFGILILLPAGLWGDVKTVQSLVDDYYEAFQRQDWEQVTACLHPGMLRDFRDALVPLMMADLAEAAGPEGEAERAEVRSVYKVERIGELATLPPRTFWLRTMAQSRGMPEIEERKKAVVRHRIVASTPDGEDGWIARVVVHTTLGADRFSAEVRFVMARHEGRFLIRDLVKARGDAAEEGELE